MKINKQTSYNKTIVISTIAIIVAVVGYGVYARATTHWPFTAVQTEQTQAHTNKPSSEEKEHSAVKSDSVPPTSTETSPKTPQKNDSPTTPASGNDFNVTITSINQVDNVVRLRSLIETIASSGTCTLTLTKSEVNVTKTSDLQALPSASTCKGFDIPTNELSPGTWKISLNVISNGKTGSATESFEVK